ncbi:MAG: hypothetical protein Aureis2KO_03770 [Aureisphaera sp.]
MGLVSLNTYAQDPELFGTWYLYEVTEIYKGYRYVVSEINPRISPSPTLTITEAFEMHAEGACNTSDATYEFDVEWQTIRYIDSVRTNDDCDFQMHEFFEDAYFRFLVSDLWYNLVSDSQGLTLYLENDALGFAVLRNYPLSSEDYSLNNSIALYPNPSSDTIQISTEQFQIQTLAVYSVTGQQVLKHVNTDNSIDVSSLSAGIYFLEVTADTGRQTTLKFIKK